MKKKYTFFKNAEKRKLYEFEIDIILSLTKIWSAYDLKEISVLNDTFENYYITANIKYINSNSKQVKFKDSIDIDGAFIEIMVLKSPNGDFSELNIVRMDTNPLIFPTIIHDRKKLDILFK